MKFELNDEQVQALIDWAEQNYIEGGTSGWGIYFDRAMAVADFLRHQAEKDSTLEKLVNSNKIVVKLDKDFKPGTGAASSYYWNSPPMMNALRKVFNCSENETIIGLVVNEHEIQAWFKIIE